MTTRQVENIVDPTPAQQRNRRIAEVSQPLPGSVPYINRRPMKVSPKFVGLSLLDFLTHNHPHISEASWSEVIAQGNMEINQRSAGPRECVSQGDRVVHVQPDTVEPPVDPNLRILFEDEALLVLEKPAPLPVHPCGRFNRNSASKLLELAFPELQLRPVHRLDANTTGVLVFAKTREAASKLARQFEVRSVEKHYLVEVVGQPEDDLLSCSAAIKKAPEEAGTRGVCADAGRPSYTEFSVLHRGNSGSSYLQANPDSGRTNQIRIHLAELGYPIVGDNAYGLERDLKNGLSKDETLHLHAWRLTLTHPLSGVTQEFVATPPKWAEGKIGHELERGE
ncbi:MAG: RluA family pseudouridine synthase [Deltaproteobacteria bacterium]|nr:RluA family pseudouridine synthase [Deltaproteobacteria bacterium]